MTHRIGPIVVATIQDVDWSSAEDTSEIYLVDDTSPFSLEGDENAREISFDFTLIEETHPEGLSVDSQRDDLKQLVTNDAKDNYFNFDDYEGRISVESVEVGEDSPLAPIRTGSIEGYYLPWPRYYPEERPLGVEKRVGQDITYSLDVSGNLEKSKFFSGSATFLLNTDADLDLASSLQSTSDYDLNITAIPSIAVDGYGGGIYGSGDYVGSFGSRVVGSSDVQATGSIIPTGSALLSGESVLDASVGVSFGNTVLNSSSTVVADPTSLIISSPFDTSASSEIEVEGSFGKDFSWDFSSYSDGTNLYNEDWYSEFNSEFVTNQFPTFEKRTSNGEEYVHIQGSSGTSEYTGIPKDLDSVDTTDVDLYMEVTPRDVSNEDNSFGFVARANKTSSGNDLYMAEYILDDPDTATVGGTRIEKLVDDTYSVIESDFSADFGIGDRMSLRFQVRGNKLKFKVWSASSSEPSQWTLTATDDSHQNDGSVGLISRNSDYSWDAWNFNVGTKQYDAPQ